MISINATNDQAREQILKRLLANTNNNITDGQITEIAASTSGFMAADLVMLIKEAGL
jgi:ATP-dependent Zn protease